MGEMHPKKTSRKSTANMKMKPLVKNVINVDVFLYNIILINFTEFVK